MSDFSQMDQLMARIKAFSADRDWEQFLDPKDLAITLSLEASELLEHFQWKTAEQMKAHLKENKEAVGDELADVFNNVLLMADCFDIDIVGAADAKMAKNEAKYPVDKSRGNNTKYTEL